MTSNECMNYMHCTNPWRHDQENALHYGMAMGGSLYGATTGIGLQQAYSQMAVAAMQCQPTTPTEPKTKMKSPRRCIERLRDEITDWHGSILKS